MSTIAIILGQLEELESRLAYARKSAAESARNIARTTRAIARAERCTPSIRRDHRIYMLARYREWHGVHVGLAEQHERECLMYIEELTSAFKPTERGYLPASRRARNNWRAHA